MGALTFIKSVYDLDTLDTRFTNSSSVPYQTIIDARSDPATSKDTHTKVQARAQPSKWQTPEFYLYYLVFLLAVPYMFWVPYSVSTRECHSPLASIVTPADFALKPRIIDITSTKSICLTAGYLGARSITPTSSTKHSEATCPIPPLSSFSTHSCERSGTPSSLRPPRIVPRLVRAV